MKKIIYLAVFLLMFTQSVYAKNADDYPQKFWDVSKDHWAFVYIADLADRGVINGYEDGSFKPNRTVTRAEWAKIMVDAAGVQIADDALYFTDMSNHWANKYVNAAKNYLTGYADGSYRPDQAATREDVTVAMVRLKGYDLSEVDYSYLSKFNDVDSVSNYAKGYVAVAVQNNLISGFEDNTFRGQDTLTRAEAATLLYRAFQHGNADKLVTAPTEPIKNDNINQSTTSNSDMTNENNEYIQQAQPNQTVTWTDDTDDTKDIDDTNKADNTDDTTEEIKSYKVETLAKLNENHNAIYDITFSTQIDDSIYYLDEDKIYKIDTISGKNEICLEIGETVIYENTDYEISGIDKVYGSSNDKKIYASCTIHYSDDFSFGDSQNIVLEIPGKEITDKKYCTTSAGYDVLFVNEDELWTQYMYGGGYLIDDGKSNDVDYLDEYWYYGEDIGYIFNCIEKNGKFYLSSETGVYVYDFNDVEQIVACEYVPIGCNENGFYIQSVNNSLVHVDFSGKKDAEISFDDIEIKDRKPIHLEAYKMYINSNDEVIFYDISSSSFRKISKN